MLKIYSVRDNKADVFAQPFCSLTDASAARLFEDWCKDADTPLGRHCEDYTLYCFGSFDEHDGSWFLESKSVIVEGRVFSRMLKGVPNVS